MFACAAPLGQCRSGLQEKRNPHKADSFFYPNLLSGILDVSLWGSQPAGVKCPFCPVLGLSEHSFASNSAPTALTVILSLLPDVVILKYEGLFLSHKPHLNTLPFSTVIVSMNSISTSLSALPLSVMLIFPSWSRTYCISMLSSALPSSCPLPSIAACNSLISCSHFDLAR